jgi:hypothetical protein
MKLSHYTTKPITKLVNKIQTGERPGWRYQPKPNGLWVSVDGEQSWPSWCEDENFGDCASQFCYSVELAADHNVLIIDTVAKMLDFDTRYPIGGDERWLDGWIYWPKVAEDYDGVIIAPYQWSQRMELMWYYGWDCASGCIWNASAIESIHEVKEAA